MVLTSLGRLADLGSHFHASPSFLVVLRSVGPSGGHGQEAVGARALAHSPPHHGSAVGSGILEAVPPQGPSEGGLRRQHLHH